MTENKRYIVKGSDDFFLHIEDTTLTEDKHEGTIDNIYQVVDRLNEQEELIKRLKQIREEQIETILKLKRKIQELETENKQLIKEWFESEKGYIIESYHDNAIRRDEKIQFLKEEFKERFGDGK